MRIFGSDRISGLMQRLGMEEGVPIEHKMVTKAIERAQKQVEAQNFSVRKHLLEYDDVMNKQRESIYSLRRELLEGKIHITEEEPVDTRELPDDARRGAARQHGRHLRGRGQSIPRSGTSARSTTAVARDLRARRRRSCDALDFDGMTPGRDDRRALGAGRSQKYEKKEALLPTRRSCTASSATSCCRSSTRSGRTTSTASTT